MGHRKVRERRADPAPGAEGRLGLCEQVLDIEVINGKGPTMRLPSGADAFISESEAILSSDETSSLCCSLGWQTWI